MRKTTTRRGLPETTFCSGAGRGSSFRNRQEKDNDIARVNFGLSRTADPDWKPPVVSDDEIITNFAGDGATMADGSRKLLAEVLPESAEEME